MKEEMSNESKKLVGGRYAFQESLGTGGEGTVYKGYDVRLGIDVAVKQFVSEKVFDESVQGRGIAMDHPAFPRVTDIFSEEGNQYVVMDYLDGVNGAAYVQNFGVLKGEQLRKVAVRICHAMNYLHQVKKVLHTDLKPENLIFCANDEIKFVDVACVDFVGSAACPHQFGTPGYSAPEVCNFGTQSKMADVFAYGATLYFLATGRIPSVERLILPSLHNKEIDKTVETVIMKCLKALPTERYFDFDEVLAQFSDTRNGTGGMKIPSINFVNNAELALEFAYVIAKRLQQNVLIGITHKAFQLLDERLIYFDAHNSVALIQAVEAQKDGRKTNVKEFAVQPDGLRGVYALVIPEQADLKEATRGYLVEKEKEFDCLIFVSMMEQGINAELNILSVSENNLEAQGLVETFEQMKIEPNNFRTVIFDGILNSEALKEASLVSDFVQRKTIAVIPRTSERQEARAQGGIVTMQMQQEMEQAYLQLARELGFRITDKTEVTVYGKQNANGNQSGRHR
ncbi:MAG: serine/threonine-protein kinase [Clostridia bacterium]